MIRSFATIGGSYCALSTIQRKLPFLVTLSPTERKRLFKMGDKRLAFVQTSLHAAQGNRNILPASSLASILMGFPAIIIWRQP